jgi:hypothetical protein
LDAIRFALIAPGDSKEREKAKGAATRVVQLRYVCERRHRPVEHGSLEFDVVVAQWVRRHGDQRVQKMAECFLESYLRKKELQAADGAAS